MRILYLIHNLADPALERRVSMLRRGGAIVSLTGFWRGARQPETVAGWPLIPLGKTADAALLSRAFRVFGLCLLQPAALRKAAREADVLLARNLEMLVIAVMLLRPRQRLVYECLDVHRSLIGTSLASRMLRALERRLMAKCALVVLSSPGFVHNYFEPLQKLARPILLVENKPLPADGPDPPVPLRSGPPWRLAWFGNLRCRRTLRELSAAVKAAPDKVAVLVAGRASAAEFPDFEQEIGAFPVEYYGPFDAADLTRLYGRCHFAWCIDYFEDGLNSDWLLPCRLYEALANGAVPIARAGTEIAHWLKEMGVGITLPRDDPGEALPHLLQSLDETAYRKLQAAVLGLPRDRLVTSLADMQRLVGALAG